MDDRTGNSDELFKLAHEINRRLYLGDGDALARALAAYIQAQQIRISDGAMLSLLSAMKSVR